MWDVLCLCVWYLCCFYIPWGTHSYSAGKCLIAMGGQGELSVIRGSKSGLIVRKIISIPCYRVFVNSNCKLQKGWCKIAKCVKYRLDRAVRIPCSNPNYLFEIFIIFELCQRRPNTLESEDGLVACSEGQDRLRPALAYVF